MTPAPMKKANEIELNDFHKARSERLVRKVSEQPSMSQEEFIEQTKGIAEQSRQAAKVVGH